MSKKENREVGEILNGITGSLTNLGKDVVDLAKIGAGKVQKAVQDYQAEAEKSKKASETESKEEVSEAESKEEAPKQEKSSKKKTKEEEQ